MKTYLRDQVDWPQAFPAEEYADRRARVCKALAAAGLDAIYITAPGNITWLTGYDMIDFHLEVLTGVLLRVDTGEATFFDYTGHTTIVSTTPAITEVVWLDHEVDGATRVIAAEIAKRGLGRARIGLELWGYGPHGTVMTRLKGSIEAGGAIIQDAWRILDEVRLVKSALEIEHMKTASAMADEAMAAGRDTIRPGLLETQLEGVIMGTMMAAGGGYPGIRSMIGSGPRAGTHHSPAQRRAIKQGDLVFVDFCGVYDRYHVNLNRTFSLGEPDPRWTDLMDKAAGCIDAIVAEAKLGDPMSRVAEIGQTYTDAAGIREYVWWVGGYCTGVALPPQWCNNHWLDTKFGMADRALEPGMFFNFENQFDVWEDWPGGSGVAYIETFMVTENGLEVMSKLPRTLVTV
jgi:Xaa-Pro aminopeptidase